MCREPDMIISSKGTEIHVYCGDDDWENDVIVVRGINFQFSNSHDRELFLHALRRCAIITEAEGGLS